LRSFIWVRGGIGGVLHSEFAGHGDLALRGLDAHDVGDHLDAVNFFRDVIHFDRYRRGSRRRHAVIGDILMDGAN
jgi:hypothetical protein